MMPQLGALFNSWFMPPAAPLHVIHSMVLSSAESTLPVGIYFYAGAIANYGPHTNKE